MKKINLNKEKIIKYIVPFIIIVLLILVGVLSYFVFYLTKQNETVIIPENNFYVKVKEDKNLDKLAMKWVKEYVEQYMQKYVKNDIRLKNLNFDSIEILDSEEKDIQVNFNVETTSKNINYFHDWGALDDKILSCQWVLKLETIENYNLSNELCFVTRRIRPAAYGLEQYNKSGESDRDQEYYQFMNKKKYQDLNKECTYKIENSSLYFTYDYSKTWQKFEVNEFEGLLGNNEYKLYDGLYQISPNLTYVYFNNKIAISNDKCKTFSIVNCGSNLGDITYIYFVDVNTGYMVVSEDYAMGSYAPAIYKTTNSGVNWNKINDYNNIGSLKKGSSFITFNENLTYIINPSADGGSSSIKVSYDSFKTFNTLVLPSGTFKGNLDQDNSKWLEIYDTPEIPKLKDGVLTLVVGQGTDGDYEGGSKAAYISNDMGKTWKFIEEFMPAPEPWEG